MRYFITLAFLSIVFLLSFLPALALDHFFDVQSIDTMKVSRDEARTISKQRIADVVNAVAVMQPTHIAVATPYDEEFYPVLKEWVTQIRSHNIKVWFRGNFSSWEGWFDYPKFKDPAEHHAKMAAFIARHPDLFEDGDIFTPAPELENGGYGDPRSLDENGKSKFKTFLRTSYETCQNSFAKIHVQMNCGYFSTNGDVARTEFTKQLVKDLGGIIVIDHYVKTNDQLIADIKRFHEEYDAQVVLGEFGAPIPDLHGSMTDSQQAAYIAEALKKLVEVRDIVKGINYWTAFGGSTAIFSDAGQPLPAVSAISSYFDPIVVTGQVTDKMGETVSHALVQVSPSVSTYTDNQGLYRIPLPPGVNTVTISNPRYQSVTFGVNIPAVEQRKTESKDIVMEFKQKDFWYWIEYLKQKLFS